MVSGWLTYAVDGLRNKFKAALQGCQPAESGGAQAETERGEYILSVRLNQAARFIIYRLKFIFRPGKRRRAAAELPGRISGCIAYRDVCRTGRLAVPEPVLHRGACGAVQAWCCFVPGRLEMCFVHFLGGEPQMPKISVLMPVYKTPEPFLREAVESILNQTAENFEFLILDDCPEDRAAEAVIASYDDARIKYFRNERNLGIAGSRNRLMEMATGDYLAVADHDDVSLPQRLEKEASYLDAHRECGVVSGWYQLLCRKRGRIRRRPEHNAEIGAALAEGCAVIHPACMLRRQELERLGVRYEEAYTPAEDYALFMRLRGRTGFYNLQEVLLLYRNFPENTSHRRRREMHAADERIKAEIREAERRRGQVMDEVRAVETELKALIRRGQREILARRRGQSAGYGSGTAGWAAFLAERYGRSVPPDKQCCWDIWDAEQAGAWDDGDEAEKNGEWSKIWKRMLNFRL